MSTSATKSTNVLRRSARIAEFAEAEAAKDQTHARCPLKACAAQSRVVQNPKKNKKAPENARELALSPMPSNSAVSVNALTGNPPDTPTSPVPSRKRALVSQAPDRGPQRSAKEIKRQRQGRYEAAASDVDMSSAAEDMAITGNQRRVTQAVRARAKRGTLGSTQPSRRSLRLQLRNGEAASVAETVETTAIHVNNATTDNQHLPPAYTQWRVDQEMFNMQVDAAINRTKAEFETLAHELSESLLNTIQWCLSDF